MKIIDEIMINKNLWKSNLIEIIVAIWVQIPDGFWILNTRPV